MKNKIIFELKLNSKDSIIAYEKNNYDSCYEDSLLYIKIGGKKTKIVESSFCYGFGAEMYYRIFNIKDFCETLNFGESLQVFYDTIKCNDDYDPNDPQSEAFFISTDFIVNDYDFANGKSLNKFTPLFIFRKKNGYKLLFAKLWEVEKTKKWKVDIQSAFDISEETFSEWKTLISTEWEKRAVIEGEKIAEANSRRKSTKEEWEEYFLFMRSDNKRD